jgi:murein L,D-transpeptidase YcbB/YkuD
MAYWEDGEKRFESKVIVGRKDRKTELFSTRLDSIVFNPTWNVPASIMRKDILPKALVNNDYFSQHHYEILQNWQSKKVISPNQIDWSAITVNNFPYKLRQKSGKKNALGLYKFNTPNEYAIYLHDTPAKYLFENINRAYSSGCIRVQKAVQFMQLLMDKSGYSPQNYAVRQKEQKTSVVALKKIITVYTTYKTAWVDELGVTQFRKDIYSYDTLNK